MLGDLDDTLTTNLIEAVAVYGYFPLVIVELRFIDTCVIANRSMNRLCEGLLVSLVLRVGTMPLAGLGCC